MKEAHPDAREGAVQAAPRLGVDGEASCRVEGRHLFLG